MKHGDKSVCRELPPFISSLCLKGFLTGKVLLSILDIQMVALNKTLLQTPPETIPKHKEAEDGGRSRELPTPPVHTTARGGRFCPWKWISSATGQVSSRSGTKTAEPLLKSDLPFSPSAAPSRQVPGVPSGMGKMRAQERG